MFTKVRPFVTFIDVCTVVLSHQSEAFVAGTQVAADGVGALVLTSAIANIALVDVDGLGLVGDVDVVADVWLAVE